MTNRLDLALRPAVLCLAMTLLLLPGLARGQVIEVVVDGAEVRSALAEVRSMQLETDGIVDGGTVRFDKLLPDTPYDIELRLKGGTILAGVNMGWYEAVDPIAAEQATPLTDDDREQIRAIVQDVPSFYDSAEILRLDGNHDRAVALVQLERRRAFHNAAEGEIIWRVELYYFENQAGGWAKIQQANQVLRRKRFRNAEEYEDEVKPIRWTPELGGLQVGKDQTRQVRVEGK